MTDRPVISVRDLAVLFPIGRGLFTPKTVVRAVEGVTLDIPRGSIFGLLGPNGAGKTTGFYMIAGLIKPLHGQVFIDDLNITKYAMHDRATAGIGYLPQEASVFRKLSVNDNILSILETRADLNRAQRLEKLEDLMREFNITHLRESPGMALSGGERRRVETLDICERAYIVSEGHIIEEGNADTVLNNEKVRKVYLGEHFRL